MTISHFDRLVWIICGVLLASSIALIVRGDRVGLEVVRLTPTEDSTASARSQIKVYFNEELVSAPPDALTLSPPVEGTTIIKGNVLVFTPISPLQTNAQYQVTLQPGVTGQSGRKLLDQQTWQFETTGARVLFIGLDDSAPNQIFIADPFADYAPTQLSQAPGPVTDFAVSPDGSQIAYSVIVTEPNRDGASDLWIMNTDGSEQRVLLDCGLAACSRPVWHPEGDRLAYERREILTVGAPPANPRLWWLDVQTNDTVPIFQDSQLLGFYASFSADGEWLSFVSPIERGIQLYNLRDGSGAVIRNRVGSPAAWSPTESVFSVADIYPTDQTFQSLISTIDAASGRTKIISEALYDELIDDAEPAWSPDGNQLTFGRKEVLTTNGRQLWITRKDGSSPLQLTNEPNMQHSSASWAPDGLSLVYQAFNIKELFAQTSVWVISVGTGQARQIYYPATQPAWLP